MKEKLLKQMARDTMSIVLSEMRAVESLIEKGVSGDSTGEATAVEICERSKSQISDLVKIHISGWPQEMKDELLHVFLNEDVNHGASKTIITIVMLHSITGEKLSAIAERMFKEAQKL